MWLKQRQGIGTRTRDRCGELVRIFGLGYRSHHPRCAVKSIIKAAKKLTIKLSVTHTSWMPVSQEQDAPKQCAGIAFNSRPRTVSHTFSNILVPETLACAIKLRNVLGICKLEIDLTFVGNGVEENTKAWSKYHLRNDLGRNIFSLLWKVKEENFDDFISYHKT
jgi:hypothetical protein